MIAEFGLGGLLRLKGLNGQLLSQGQESGLGTRKHLVFCQALSTRDQVEIRVCQERELACVGVDP